MNERLSPLERARRDRPTGIRTPEDLGRALQFARYSAGLSQRDVARRLGISQRYVVEIEAGKPSLYTERLFAMLEMLGAHLELLAPSAAERHGTEPMWMRVATPRDAPLLHELAAATFPLACPPHAPTSAIAAFIEEHLSVAAFERHLADPDREIITADARVTWPSGTPQPARIAAGLPDMLVAYAMLVYGAPQDPDVAAVVSGAGVVELSKCYVRPEQHGTPTAHELMAAVLAAARARGAATIWLGVNDENVRAQRFYAKHGFERIGMKRFHLGDRVEDDYVMARAL